MSHAALKMIIVCILLPVSSLTAQTRVLNVGEKLVYSASFNYIPAGIAELTVEGIDTLFDREALHVRYSAKSGKVVDRLFKIRDQIDTWLDLETLVTYRQIKDISEGLYTYNSDTWMNYADSIAVSGNDTTRLASHVRDPYSLFYYLRTLELPEDTIMTFTTFDRKKLTTFKMKVGKTTTLSVPAGNFECFHVKPYHKSRDLFKNKGEMDLWFSRDERRLPVQILVRLKYGSLFLKLQRFNL